MIPAEAVEAAAKALYERKQGPFVPWANVDKTTRRSFMGDARTALESAAPYIRSQALEDAAGEIASDGDAADIHIIAWLHMRAAAERDAHGDD